jgi:hypothetical protein
LYTHSIRLEISIAHSISDVDLFGCR